MQLDDQGSPVARRTRGAQLRSQSFEPSTTSNPRKATRRTTRNRSVSAEAQETPKKRKRNKALETVAEEELPQLEYVQEYVQEIDQDEEQLLVDEVQSLDFVEQELLEEEDDMEGSSDSLSRDDISEEEMVQVRRAATLTSRIKPAALPFAPSKTTNVQPDVHPAESKGANMRRDLQLNSDNEFPSPGTRARDARDERVRNEKAEPYKPPPKSKALQVTRSSKGKQRAV